MTKQTRKIKLQSKWRRSADWRTSKEVPWLNVSGHWLAAAGFTAGQPVEIRIDSNQLIITNLALDGHR